MFYDIWCVCCFPWACITHAHRLFKLNSLYSLKKKIRRNFSLTRLCFMKHTKQWPTANLANNQIPDPKSGSKNFSNCVVWLMRFNQILANTHSIACRCHLRWELLNPNERMNYWQNIEWIKGNTSPAHISNPMVTI